MTVKVSAKLTKEESAYNGLDPLRAELVDQPHGRRYAVVAFEVVRVQTEIADGEEIPTVRMVHIEPVKDGAADQVRELLEATHKERTGRDPQLEMGFGVDGPDGEREVPEASGEEILAERRERLALVNSESDA